MVDLPENAVYFASAAEFRAWLLAHHDDESGIWLVRNKKDSGLLVLTYDEIVDTVICFGWIDSLPRSLDTTRTMLWVAPRKPKSNWSRINRDKVERLIAEGRMEPAGMRKVELAQADGSWTRLNVVDELVVPDDLADAFRGFEHAAAHFAAFPKSVRRGILEWILNAKRPETRAQRIRETSRLADLNRRANQWRDPQSPC
jgi:uncharacterized protein YdeI (YjbR/CyaY-like superfamily)